MDLIPESQNNTLVIITESYPFSDFSERAYFEPELYVLARHFSRIIILPRYRRCPSALMPEIPNIDVSTDWLDHADYRNKWRRLRYLPFILKKGRISGEHHKKLSLTYGLSAIAMAKMFERWIEKKNINLSATVFYSFWFDYSTTSLALLSDILKKDIKIVSRVHSYFEMSSVAQHLKKYTVSFLRAVYPVSAYSRTLFNKCIGENINTDIKIIPLGCMDHKVSASMSRKNDKDSFVFFTACRISKEKSIGKMFEFMDALAIAREEKIKWIIAGDGEDRGYLIALLNSTKNKNLDIEWLGAIDNSMVHQIYDSYQVDWSFLLSPEEGLPVSLCESLMHGVPAIANDVGGISEIIDDDSGILLARNPEKEEFVRGIAPFLDSRQRYDCLAAGARRHWEEKFDAIKLRDVFSKEILSLK